jgi:stage V sporulation protein B
MSSIAKSALWVTISEIIFNLSGFVIHAVLGRFLGPADYGRYGIVITLTTMIIILIGNGIPTAMAKYISEVFETNPRTVLSIKKQAIRLQIMIIGAITVLFYLTAPLVAQVLNDPTLTPLFRLSTLIIPAFAAASFYFSYYTGLHKFNTQATLKTMRSVFRIGLVIGLAFLFQLKGAIAGYIVAPTATFLIALGIDKLKIGKIIKKKSNDEISDTIDFPWQKLFNYAWQVVIFFLAYELLISIDLYMVKAILKSDSLTGIYNAALTVGRIPYYIFYAMTIFMLPMVSKASVNNNFKNAGPIITQALRMMLILLVPMIVLMSFYSSETLTLLYGKKYIAGATAMSILEYGVGFLTIFYVLSFALNGAGKTKIAMWISTIGVIINTILNYFFILHFGIIGSALATAITSFFIMLIALYYTKRDFGASINFVEFLKVTFGGILCYFIAYFLPSGKWLFLLDSIFITAIYLAVLYLLKGITKKDLEYFQGLLKSRKKEEVEAELSGNEPGA